MTTEQWCRVIFIQMLLSTAIILVNCYEISHTEKNTALISESNRIVGGTGGAFLKAFMLARLIYQSFQPNTG